MFKWIMSWFKKESPTPTFKTVGELAEYNALSIPDFMKKRPKIYDKGLPYMEDSLDKYFETGEVTPDMVKNYECSMKEFKDFTGMKFDSPSVEDNAGGI